MWIESKNENIVFERLKDQYGFSRFSPCLNRFSIERELDDLAAAVGRNARSSKSLFSTSANFTTFPISLGCVWRQQIISFSKDLTTLVPCTNSDRFSQCRRGLWTRALVFRLILISYSTLYSVVRQSKHVWNSTTVCSVQSVGAITTAKSDNDLPAASIRQR